MTGNRQIRVASRPTGIPQPEHFELVEAERPRPGRGQLLIRNLFLSVEPAMRGWLVDTSNYAEPVPVGAVMRALGVGEVVESDNPAYPPGEVLLGWFGWQEWAAVDPSAVVRRIVERDLPSSLALGVLGLNGVTALLALEKIGAPRPGETVLVSTAAGSVGSAVGQVAKLLGCRTVGIVGGPDKVRQCLDDFGYDAAIDYRADGLDPALAAACPDGVHVYFDNVAGPISDAAMRQLAIGARVVICGTAAIRNWVPVPEGPRVERILLTRRARMEGFVIFDHMADYDGAVRRLADWVRDGSLRYREDMLDGIEHCLHSIADLYESRNAGKRIIRLNP